MLVLYRTTNISSMSIKDFNLLDVHDLLSFMIFIPLSVWQIFKYLISLG